MSTARTIDTSPWDGDDWNDPPLDSYERDWAIDVVDIDPYFQGTVRA
jgi:hypothetical protein